MALLGSGNKQKKIGDLRRSQIITTFGPGALADFPKYSGIMAGLEVWRTYALPEEQIIHEKNLERLLGKEYFIQPSSPPKKKEDDEDPFGLPVFRFPNYYYCPGCHQLDEVRRIGKNGKCNNCGKVLIPSRFIISCINGHIDDFPYVWWVHRRKGYCNAPGRLLLKYEGKTGGLDSIKIECETCGAVESMQGCMRQDALKGLKCKGKMPWLGQGYTDPEKCDAQVRTLQRGASNIYYSVNENALTIPPWSNMIQKFIDKHYSFISMCAEEDDPDMRAIMIKNSYKKLKVEELCHCSLNDYISEVGKRFGEAEEEINDKTLIINEYKAFCMHDIDDPYFKTSSEMVPPDFNEAIADVKLVKRLREVQVIKGFRRIVPDYDTEKSGMEGLFERDYCPLSKKPLSWLPAVELFGEGIFIRFKESELNIWEELNGSRYDEMLKRLNGRKIGKEMLSPRYVLLHTFAHMLIRQLAFQSGYSAASLKEKIYSTYPSSDTPMSGILIYTAATDCDGSLGGLLREGRQERLNNTLKAILEESSWCSNDPICIESKAQGMDSLNYAACHACVLLPETSCEARNCLLDRAAVTGTPDSPEIGFFNKYL